MGFVSNSLADGRSFRALTNRGSLQAEVPSDRGRSELPGTRFVRVLEQLAKERALQRDRNVQVSLDYAQSLLHAKDLPEVMRLHREFVQSQMRSLVEQASEIGQIVTAAMDAAKSKI